MVKKKSAGTKALIVLEQAKVPYRLLTYTHENKSGLSFGAEAAEKLGFDGEKVFKTLLVQTDKGPVVAVIPVNGRLSLRLVARAQGAKKAQMMEVSEAEKLTGYVAGGISPLGQLRSFPTLVDSSAKGLAEIIVSGGRRGYSVALAPADLLSLTAGQFVELSSIS